LYCTPKYGRIAHVVSAKLAYMKKMLGFALCAGMALFVPAQRAGAQGFEVLGTRAAGMGGAFVAVADDSSAVYWNPAGLASGSYFSLLLDQNGGQIAPPLDTRGIDRSGFLLALSMPALGLSYSRLHSIAVSPIDPSETGRNGEGTTLRLDSLIVHSLGSTFVQSIAPGISVGTTGKLVRGIAARGAVDGISRDDLLDEGGAIVGRATNKFDVDLGVMAVFGVLKAGLTVRNLTEPSFDFAGDAGSIRLKRQARAGIAVSPYAGWLADVDVDVTRNEGPFGDRREMAIGGEGHVIRRGFFRGGYRFNTLSGQAGGRAGAFSFGGSYAVKGAVLIDAQYTNGTDLEGHGWGVGARFVY
jgi:hypothetical protein